MLAAALLEAMLQKTAVERAPTGTIVALPAGQAVVYGLLAAALIDGLLGREKADINVQWQRLMMI